MGGLKQKIIKIINKEGLSIQDVNSLVDKLINKKNTE